MKSRTAIVIIFALLMAGWFIAPAQGAPAARIDGTAGLKMEKQAPGPGMIAGQGLVYATTLANLTSNDATGVKVLDLAPPGTQPLNVKRATTTLTNNTPGAADGSSLDRTVTVPIGLFPAGSMVLNVRVIIDFNKIDDGQPPAGCGATPGSDPWNEEMYFYLTSPAGTRVVLAESAANRGGSGLGATYSQGDVYNGPYVVVFDDEALLAAGPVPLSGTFRPEQPLSGFDGESPSGAWTLTVGDDAVQDPLCFAAFALELTASSEPVTDLVLDKAGPATVVAGEPIAYTIVVTNNGPSAAPMVEIVDNLPDEVAFLNAAIARSSSGPDGECAYAICQAADVQFGEVLTMTLTGLVDPGVPAGTVLNNGATAFADGDLQPDAGDSHTTTVQAAADLSVAKVALAESVAPSEGLLYQITVANDGPSDARGVRITDTLETNVTFVSASPGCSYDAGTHQVICDLGQLAAGSSAHVLLAVTVGPVPGGTVLTNQAIVSSDVADPAPGNNADSETTDVVQQQEPNVELSITKTAEPATVNAGDLVTYRLTVRNAGPQVATNVEVLELLPDGTTLVSMQAHNPNSAYEFCTPGGICYLGTVALDTTALITVVLRVDASMADGPMTNMAAVTAGQPDNMPDNNLAHATVTVVGSPTMDLILVKTGPAAVQPGGQAVYSIVVTNDGLTTAGSVDIEDNLPAGIEFVSATIQRAGLGPAPCSGSTCQAGDMAAGEVVTMTVTGRVRADLAPGTTLNNQATASCSTPEATVDNNTDEHIAVVQHTSIYLPLVTRNGGAVSLPDLVGKIYFAPDKNNWSSGESVLLTVVVTNTGSAPAGAFWVDLYINPNPAPAGANVPWNETCTLTPCYGLAWQHAGALAPGESVVLTSTPTSYDVNTSLWVGSFAPGTTDVYLWVDSWNPGSSVGAVQEGNELNNGDARHGLSVTGGGAQPDVSPVPVFPPRTLAGTPVPR